MIALNRMYVQRRKTGKTVLAITAVCALASTIVVSWGTGWATFRTQLLDQSILSLSIGLLFWLDVPALMRSTERLTLVPRWAARLCGAVVTLNVGMMIGMGILAARGVFPWGSYWDMVWDAAVPLTVIGLICSVVYMTYETLKYRAHYETTQARLSSLESRLRPHFLFNTLNSILALIPEDPKSAEHVTERLAALLRYSLDSTGHNTVPLAEELKVATDYLEIEKVRFGERLRYSVDVTHHVMQSEVPPFSLQTLVENSVKHGGGEIRISVHNGNERLVLRVWDSGDGFPSNGDLPVGHGLYDLKERLDRLWGSRATIAFPHADAGTTVEISLPAPPR